MPALPIIRRDASITSRLTRRQTVVDPILGPLLPTTYLGTTTDLSPGAVVGITLGAVLGFLLLVGLIMWAVAANPAFTTTEEIIEVRSRRSPSRRIERRGSHRSSRYSPRSSRDYGGGRRTTIVEERVEIAPGGYAHSHGGYSRGGSPGPPPPPPPPMMSGAANGSVVFEDRAPRRHRDEVVEVIEDGSDYSSLPRGGGRRRSSGYYRDVDPDRFAGGDYPRRSVSRR